MSRDQEVVDGGKGSLGIRLMRVSSIDVRLTYQGLLFIQIHNYPRVAHIWQVGEGREEINHHVDICRSFVGGASADVGDDDEAVTHTLLLLLLLLQPHKM